MPWDTTGWGLLSPSDVTAVKQTLDIVIDRFRNITTLEIGLFDGRTSKMIHQYVTDKHSDHSAWGMDNNLDNHVLAERAKNLYPEFQFVFGDSSELFDKVPNPHWVFVDGCHCINHVMLDFLHYGEKLETGGVIVFHDTSAKFQNTGWQRHGPQNSDFHIAVIRALNKLGLMTGRLQGWAKVVDSSNPGGVIAFQKTYRSPVQTVLL